MIRYLSDTADQIIEAAEEPGRKYAWRLFKANACVAAVLILLGSIIMLLTLPTSRV